NMLTRCDKILIAVIALLCVLSVGLIFTGGGGTKVVITVDNKEVAVLPLYKNGEQTVKTEYGTNTVTVKDGKCFVSHTDCKNLICKNTAAIYKTGQAVVCAPHHLVAEVR
ncbi:MAG: NusG domain II-containing protein, partial [Oscillospiraceae bacterium]|nr:NusG domain II-containing protein [Candidatus Equicaccousia limihippi]